MSLWDEAEGAPLPQMMAQNHERHVQAMIAAMRRDNELKAQQFRLSELERIEERFRRARGIHAPVLVPRNLIRPYVEAALVAENDRKLERGRQQELEEINFGPSLDQKIAMVKRQFASIEQDVGHAKKYGFLRPRRRETVILSPGIACFALGQVPETRT